MVVINANPTKKTFLWSANCLALKRRKLLPPNMLMMNASLKMTETGGNFDKSAAEAAELDIATDLPF